MRTVKWDIFLSGVCAIVGGAVLCVGVARAEVSSTNPAAIVIFPKIVVDHSSSDIVTDTIIQLTNTAASPVNVRCFYVNANGHCVGDPSIICDPNADPTSTGCDLLGCAPSWSETDFAFTLTSNQPIKWLAGDGLVQDGLPLTNGEFGPGGESNSGFIPGTPEDPMKGELKCIEVDSTESPFAPTCLSAGNPCASDADCTAPDFCYGNDLKGEATIEFVDTSDDAPFVDAEGYNAIGIRALSGDGVNDGNNALVLGTEYEACPTYLILDHYFDNAEEPAFGDTVTTNLTLVPCSEDFNFQAPITTVVQFLVYNEFEQRFSTSRSVTCFSELPLDSIHPVIFDVATQGTLTGQTLIRGVADSSTTYGHGLLGIAEEFEGDYTASINLHKRGQRTQPDIILLPMAEPPGS